MRYSEIFKEAKRLHDMGLAIHWLHVKSKRPIESGWTSGPRKEWNYLAETYTNDLNLGVRTGTPSKLKNGYLAIIDVDVKSKAPHHLNEVESEVKRLLKTPELFPCVASGRGNGSRHYYCVSRSPFKTFNPAQSKDIIKVLQPSKKPSKKELEALSSKEIDQGWRLSHAWEISFYSDGRQVVLPPSVHPDSGELYRWVEPLAKTSALPVLPDSSYDGSATTLDDVTKAYAGKEELFVDPWEKREAGKEELFVDPWEKREAGTLTREAGQATKRSEVAAFDFQVEPVELEWLPISDEVRDAIVNGTGVEDRSGYLMRASNALISAGLNQNEVLTVLTDPKTFLGACGYDHAKTKKRDVAARWVYRYTVAKVSAERSAEGIFTKASEAPKPRKLTPEEMAAQKEEFDLEWSWKQDLNKNGKGFTTPSLKNLDLIFSNAIDENVFIEDLFASRIEYGVDTPWGGKKKDYIKDIDMVLVKRWLADTEFQIEPNTSAILEATSLVAHRMRIHPVIEWLESLKWDGKPRVNTWIKDFCEGEAEEPYLSEISRKFVLAMVKRVFEPGCQWDYVLVLEGKQGKFKSSIARALAGDKWFMDNLPDLKDKDSMLNLQGKWLIELGELTNVKRSDHNLVKAYLVRRTDTVRPHYGRLMSDVPRQSVFIGTVNEGQYLKDPTGNRRFWPVKVGNCDVKGLTANRDQIFAEAVHIYKTMNEVLMLGPEATEQATIAQEDRREEDDVSDMKDVLVRFLRSEEGLKFKFEFFTQDDLIYGSGGPWSRWNGKPYVKQNGANALKSLGCEQIRTNSERGWTLPKTLFNKYCGPPKTSVTRSVTPSPENDEEMNFY
jgi:hypothetical protein